MDELARLASLHSYSILDSEPERDFDDLTRIAAEICKVPVSLVALIAENRQWFKSSRGLNGLTETSREVSFCAHTLKTKQILIVPDASIDPSFRENPLVLGDPNIRFYAGAPIIEKEGHVLGTVCVIDTVPRAMSGSQVDALEALARMAGRLIEQRTIDAERNRLEERAQHALEMARVHQERLELAVDAAGLAAWYYDPLKGIVGGDERMAAFFGLPSPSGPAQLWLNAIVEEDRPRVTEEFAASIQGAPYDTTYRVQVKGHLRWLHARAKLTPEANGSVRMVGICDDVTTEKLLSEELEKTAERLAVAQGASGAVTFDWDLIHDRVTWGADLFGRSRSELRSSGDFFKLLSDSEKQPLSRVVEDAIRNGSDYHHEYCINAPDGETLWYRTSGKPLKNDQGVVVSVVGVNIDITERKRAESALMKSEKLAAVGRLASTIAHEINNPLEAVTNLLFLARVNTKEPEVSSWLDQADLELRRVSGIASQTLRFHRQSSRPEPITCLSLFSSTLNLYQARLTNSGITVEKRKRANEPVRCFEGDIRQVLSNLVTNAIDAMPHGGRLFVRSREGTDWRTGRKGLVLTLADDGSGMDAATRRRAFEAFYTTKGIGGSGLGLWISLEIVERHHGRLLLRSSNADGRHGTVASLFLPLELNSGQSLG